MVLVLKGATITGKQFSNSLLSLYRELRTDLEMESGIMDISKGSSSTKDKSFETVSNLISENKKSFEKDDQARKEIKIFSRIAERNNINFAIKPGSTVEDGPRNLVFFKSTRDKDLMNALSEYGFDLEKRLTRTTFKEKLEELTAPYKESKFLKRMAEIDNERDR